MSADVLVLVIENVIRKMYFLVKYIHCMILNFTPIQLFDSFSDNLLCAFILFLQVIKQTNCDKLSYTVVHIAEIYLHQQQCIQSR